MKIKDISIENFGKFNQYSLTFNEGFQIIYGKNEAGKTTLMTFLNMMFYSKQRNPLSLFDNLRNKFSPWNNGPTIGSINFTHNGENFYLSKHFASTASKDNVLLINSNTGEKITLARGEEIGKRFFGLDLSGFERSSYISQLGPVKPIDSKKDDIFDKLVENIISGNEASVHKDVLTRLEAAKFDLISKSGNKGSLVADKKNLEALKHKYAKIDQHLKSQKKLLEERALLESEYNLKTKLEQLRASYKAKKRVSKLNILVENISKQKSLESNLFLSTFSKESFDDFLTTAQNYKQNILVLENQIKILSPNIKKGLVPINSAEYKTFENLAENLNSKKHLLYLWLNELSPIIESNKKERDELIHIKSQINRQASLHDKLSMDLEQLEETESLKSDISQLDFQLRQLELEKKLLQNQKESILKGLSQQIEAIKKSHKSYVKYILVAMGILVYPPLLFIAIKYSSYSALFLFIAFTMISFLLSLPKKSDKNRIKELKQTIHEQKQSFNSTLIKIEDQTDSALKEHKKKSASLKALGRQTLSLDFISDQLSVLDKELQDLKEKRIRLEGSIDKLSSLIDQKFSYLSDQVDSLNEEFLSFDPLLHSNNIKNLFEKALSTAEAELLAFIEKKSCSSINSFKSAYSAYTSQLNFINILNQHKNELKNAKLLFINHLSHHSPVNTHAEAMDLLNTLLEKHNQLNSLTASINTQKQILSLKSLDLEKINFEITNNAKIAILFDSANLDIEYINNSLASIGAKDYMTLLNTLNSKIIPAEENPEDLQREIQALEEKVEDKELYYDALSLAIVAIEKAQEKMRSSFGPELNKKASRIFFEITERPNSTLLVDKHYDISIKENLEFKDWGYMSHGTIDQIYFALRIAMSEIIAPKEARLPLILDDAFMQYDDFRAYKAISFLKKHTLENNIQAFLFSCHERMIAFAKELSIPIIDIVSRKPL